MQTTLLLCLVLTAGDEPAAESPWIAIAREHVDGYQLKLTDKPDRALTRVPAAVCQHVQNVRGNAVGSVFIWTDPTGRPAAICDVFFLPSKGKTYMLYDEWHSLSSASMTAQWQEQVRWSPSEPGLTWQVLPDAGVPEARPERRSLQVRQFARRFTAHIISKSGDRYELRMLTTPIFRYDTSDTTESLGGGMFAFCQGNDPEVLLLIEARRHNNGARWEYAVAEYSNLNQYVQLDGQEVWHATPPTFSSQGRHVAGPLRVVERPGP